MTSEYIVSVRIRSSDPGLAAWMLIHDGVDDELVDGVIDFSVQRAQ